ncbi:MAG TPA: amino acid adenylation domain-containing protein, partial [Longimicrobium sp.]|nr:amino acid adenylation domain-containing protein [Longimicrobium sp.]
MSDADILRLRVPSLAGPGAGAADAPDDADARARLTAARQALREARLRGAHRAAPLVRRPSGGDLPLSFAQERFWFLERLQSGLPLYNIGGAERLDGPLDARVLERALDQVVRRHESLRAVFDEVDGVPVQRILPPADFALPVDDLSALSPAERTAAAWRLASEQALRPFDLRAGPLFRARLLRMAGEEHVLLLALHHIVADGWSLGVLLDEARALYAALRDGLPPPLPEPPVQYADYAAWQRERMQGAELERLLAYWRARLAGAPELLALPTDRPRPPVPSFRGGSVPVRVPPAALAGLRALARDEGASLYMVALAAFQALLGRYAGTDDVVVGSPVSGRARREVEGLIGLFINTLVVRTDLSGDPTFRQLLRRVREGVLGDFAHQEMPFERLVAELRPERSLGYATLFQALFQLDERAAAAGRRGLPAGEGAPAQEAQTEEESTALDLALLLEVDDEGMGGVLQYAADLFDHATARRMAGHLLRLMESVAADPDRPLSRVPLLDAEERARLAEWNRTAAPYPADRCVHRFWEAQAERTPHAAAVIHDGRSLTYAEVEARANRIAHHLRGLGVGPEVRVGLCMERGMELVPALLGVMKAGGAWVPMDPAHPAERLSYLLSDSGVSVLLTQARLRERLPAADGVRVLAVDAGWPRIAAESAERPESGVGPENLCYVIYTSGSTGRPKGVAMHHRGVANYLAWGIRHYAADRGNGAPVFTSMAVDLTITNLLPLFAGRPVRMLPEKGAVEALAREIRGRPGFGLIKITPVHLGLLNEMLDPADLAGAAHTLVIGADSLSAEPTLPWQEHAPAVRLMNEYGPTETVVGCSAYTLPPGAHRTGPVPVGGPIQNLTFHVLDPRGEPVPVGLPGELYIGGAGVARGYLERPALTADTFVPDPFAAPGARMYRTGDRARRLADGGLTILGRTDHQVKVRGYRVEPGEIEAVLLRHPSVSDCRVVPREDRPGDRRLVAYVAGRAGADELRAHLRRTLPEYMVPSAFVVMDALPQTATGKLDPGALPAPEYGVADAEPEAPLNEVEARLVEIWEELLGVRGIGTSQGWFDLGGNSLLALRLFTRVNREMGYDLPVATLFTGATVRHMAAAVLAQRTASSPAAGGGSVVPLQAQGALPPLFLVHAGDRDVLGYVTLVRHLGPDQPAYGVRDVGEDLARPLARIAAEHVAAVRAVRPHGPYALMGWSFGGMVAFEMAAQLQRAGEAVAFVGLMDTMAPDVVQAFDESDDALLVGLAEEFAEGWGWAFSLSPETLGGVAAEEKPERVVRALRAQGPVPGSFGAARLAEAFDAVRARMESGRGYVPGRFHGTVDLFRAAEPYAYREALFAGRAPEVERVLGWQTHVSGTVEVHTIPGTHVTLGSEPNVRVLA